MSTPAAAKMFNVFLDSDGPIADYDAALSAAGVHTDDFKYLPGIYLWLSITRGAAEAISRLKQLDDLGFIRVWVATKTPSKSPYAYTEKVLWYRKNFPWLEDRIILTHDKHLLGQESDFLLDDRPHKANAELFRGTFVLFNITTPEEDWANLIDQVEARVNFSKSMLTVE